MKKQILVYMLVMFSFYSFSQGKSAELSFWKLTSLNGALNLNTNYWEQITKRSSAEEQIKNTLFSGGLFLKSKSYFYHPNFLEVTLDVGFSPETGQLLSLVAPDQAETNTLKKLFTQFSFFKKRTLNLTVFANVNEGYSNRENLSNIKIDSKNFGGTFTSSNKFVPITITYNQGKTNFEELQTDRKYKTEDTTLEGRASKSFGENDSHKFIFSKRDYVFDDTFVALSQNPLEGTFTENQITTLNLTNNLYFDSKRKFNFRSMISKENQNGSSLTYQRLQVIENLFFKLPWNFNFSSNYSLFDTKQNSIVSKQQNTNTELSHQLYKSLYSSINYEFNTINSTQFEELNKRAGYNLKYVKKIPLKGHLELFYNLNSNILENSSDKLIVTILNEEYTLTDGQIVLLKNQRVDSGTILVKDITGTIIYQENLDYILIVRNDFLEIQRIPGSQIANNSAVFIDYIASIPASYKYNAITTNYGINLSFLNKKIEFYFRKGKQDYLDLVNVGSFALNYYNQNVYGGRFNFGMVSGEVMQDNYESNIIPYKLTRYNLIIQGTINQHILYNFNGTFRDYQMILVEGEKQQYLNLSANIVYNINRTTKLSLQGSYLDQNGDTEGIDLNVLTSRIQVNTKFRKIYITAGIEIYKNEFLNENIDFKKFNLQIIRKF